MSVTFSFCTSELKIYKEMFRGSKKSLQKFQSSINKELRNRTVASLSLSACSSVCVSAGDNSSANG
jgi:hypothetical protein